MTLGLRMLMWTGALVALAEVSLGQADKPVDYIQQIKPILEKRCYACHGALQQKGGLRVDTAEFLRKGGESGAVLTPGDASKSRLMELVARTGDLKMPPEGEGSPLTADELHLLRRWIDSGAVSSVKEQPQADPRDWWSYRLPQRPANPTPKDGSLIRTPIDAFIAARRDTLGLAAVPETDRATWLRRVTLDLIGLPPTRAELESFLQDQSEDAYEKVVDDLLKRPQYGERWGRHWMDVWRYSDWYGSRGINEIRYSQRHIWRWRDWIVESLNDDKPYDRMVVEMLAADEVAPQDPKVLAATGFIGRNWYKFDRNVWMFDLVEHTGQAFLGLTLKCCRCHDHKYDPVSQEEYYRFRAFFEPHDVRTDRLDPSVGFEKDATLGDVLKDGVARVYDKQLNAPTYLFQRGDNRDPDESRPLTPGVPSAFRSELPAIAEIKLPSEAFYPALNPRIANGLVDQAREAAKKVETEIAAAKAALKTAEAKLAATRDLPMGGNAALPGFHDDFSKPRPEDWQALSGDWVYEGGHIVQKSITSFATMVSRQPSPRDFAARIRYRPLASAGLRSVGFSFDYIDQGNSQDVYTHTGENSQTVQAFHRFGGQQVYPPAAIVKTTDLKVGDVATIEIAVRGANLTIHLNGTRRLDYVMPVARRDGKFAIWVHDGSAEFLEVDVRPLLPSRDDARREVMNSLSAIALAEQKLRIGTVQAESLRLRIEAERATYLPGNDEAAIRMAKVAAGRSEAAVAVAKAEEAVLQAEQNCQLARPLLTEDGSADALSAENLDRPGLREAEAKLAAAKANLVAARQQFDSPTDKYAPVGDVFPATSSGRRTALAAWIASRQNPRTARVAINHMWLRHFGQPLVASMGNFGLNGDRPTHPELLDWLSVELMENGWHMKALHRMIVLSNTYRLSSATASTSPIDLELIAANSKLDPTNQYLWRMNSRRMEAEVVRDSVLFAAGSLDLTQGGPEIPEAQGQTTLRRSLYFRNTPNEKMKFLELFDVADPNACYRRRESVVPQQALALMNSALALDQSRLLAEKLNAQVGSADDESTCRKFIAAAFETILNQSPSLREMDASLRYLREPNAAGAGNSPVYSPGGQSQRGPSTNLHLRARENLVHVLFSHNAFVTIR